MKESLPEGWMWAKIGDIAEVIGGSTPLRSEKRYFGGDIVWLTPTEIPKGTVSLIFDSKDKLTREGFDASGVRWIPAGSVLLTSRASIGYVAIAGTQVTTNQGFATFVLFEGIDPAYFGWWLKSQKNNLEDLARGTTFKEISKATLKEIFVPIAPTGEQNRITAAIEQQFTRLDDAIASLQSAKARVKQYRASLLKAAVGGELTKEWRTEHPTEETGVQLLVRILVERRTRWEDEQLAKMREQGITPKDDKWKQAYKEPQRPDVEQLPALPEGWCWGTLEQCSRRITDGTHQPPRFVETGIPFIFVKHIVKGQISFEDTKYISEATYQELNSRCPVEVGDVLYSAVGSYGVAVPVLISQPFSFQRHIAHIKPSPLLDLSYLVTCLNSSTGLEQAHRVARGVAQKTVALTDLARFVIPLPPFAEQEQIVSEVEARLSNIAKLEEVTENNLKRAEHERQSILRAAFAGRLVPQDPEDEPASVLLERIREERKKREETEKVARASRKEIQMEVAKKRRSGKASLYTTLVEVGHPLPPDDLFNRADLKVDEQTESVEVFYEELHANENVLIRETRPDDAHVLLEALEPSAEMLARMAEAARQAQEEEQSEETINAPKLWNI